MNNNDDSNDIILSLYNTRNYFSIKSKNEKDLFLNYFTHTQFICSIIIIVVFETIFNCFFFENSSIKNQYVISLGYNISDGIYKNLSFVSFIYSLFNALVIIFCKCRILVEIFVFSFCENRNFVKNNFSINYNISNTSSISNNHINSNNIKNNNNNNKNINKNYSNNSKINSNSSINNEITSFIVFVNTIKKIRTNLVVFMKSCCFYIYSKDNGDETNKNNKESISNDYSHYCYYKSIKLLVFIFISLSLQVKYDLIVILNMILINIVVTYVEFCFSFYLLKIYWRIKLELKLINKENILLREAICKFKIKYIKCSKLNVNNNSNANANANDSNINNKENTNENKENILGCTFSLEIVNELSRISSIAKYSEFIKTNNKQKSLVSKNSNYNNIDIINSNNNSNYDILLGNISDDPKLAEISDFINIIINNYLLRLNEDDISNIKNNNNGRDESKIDSNDYFFLDKYTTYNTALKVYYNISFSKSNISIKEILDNFKKNNNRNNLAAKVKLIKPYLCSLNIIVKDISWTLTKESNMKKSLKLAKYLHDFKSPLLLINEIVYSLLEKEEKRNSKNNMKSYQINSYNVTNNVANNINAPEFFLNVPSNMISSSNNNNKNNFNMNNINNTNNNNTNNNNINNNNINNNRNAYSIQDINLNNITTTLNSNQNNINKDNHIVNNNNNYGNNDDIDNKDTTSLELKGLLSSIDYMNEIIDIVNQFTIIENNFKLTSNTLMQKLVKKETKKIVELKPLLESIETFFLTKLRFNITKAKKVSFILSLAHDLPVKIKINDTEFKQILHNLLSNSIKFTYNGSIKLSVSKINNKLRVTVEDSGVGIKKEMIRLLGKPYEMSKDNNSNSNNNNINNNESNNISDNEVIYNNDIKRDNSSTSNVNIKNDIILKEFNSNTYVNCGNSNFSNKGSGLGISIVCDLLKNNNSRLKIESELGRGSCFSFDYDCLLDEDKDISEDSMKNNNRNSFGEIYYRKAYTSKTLNRFHNWLKNNSNSNNNDESNKIKEDSNNEYKRNSNDSNDNEKHNYNDNDNNTNIANMSSCIGYDNNFNNKLRMTGGSEKHYTRNKINQQRCFNISKSNKNNIDLNLNYVINSSSKDNITLSNKKSNKSNDDTYHKRVNRSSRSDLATIGNNLINNNSNAYSFIKSNYNFNNNNNINNANNTNISNIIANASNNISSKFNTNQTIKSLHSMQSSKVSNKQQQLIKLNSRTSNLNYLNITNNSNTSNIRSNVLSKEEDNSNTNSKNTNTNNISSSNNINNINSFNNVNNNNNNNNTCHRFNKSKTLYPQNRTSKNYFSTLCNSPMSMIKSKRIKRKSSYQKECSHLIKYIKNKFKLEFDSFINDCYSLSPNKRVRLSKKQKQDHISTRTLTKSIGKTLRIHNRKNNIISNSNNININIQEYNSNVINFNKRKKKNSGAKISDNINSINQYSSSYDSDSKNNSLRNSKDKDKNSDSDINYIKSCDSIKNTSNNKSSAAFNSRAKGLPIVSNNTLYEVDSLCNSNLVNRTNGSRNKSNYSSSGSSYDSNNTNTQAIRLSSIETVDNDEPTILYEGFFSVNYSFNNKSNSNKNTSNNSNNTDNTNKSNFNNNNSNSDSQPKLVKKNSILKQKRSIIDTNEEGMLSNNQTSKSKNNKTVLFKDIPSFEYEEKKEEDIMSPYRKPLSQFKFSNSQLNNIENTDNYNKMNDEDNTKSKYSFNYLSNSIQNCNNSNNNLAAVNNKLSTINSNDNKLSNKGNVNHKLFSNSDNHIINNLNNLNINNNSIANNNSNSNSNNNNNDFTFNSLNSMKPFHKKTNTLSFIQIKSSKNFKDVLKNTENKKSFSEKIKSIGSLQWVDYQDFFKQFFIQKSRYENYFQEGQNINNNTNNNNNNNNNNSKTNKYSSSLGINNNAFKFNKIGNVSDEFNNDNDANKNIVKIKKKDSKSISNKYLGRAICADINEEVAGRIIQTKIEIRSNNSLGARNNIQDSITISNTKANQSVGVTNKSKDKKKDNKENVINSNKVLADLKNNRNNNSKIKLKDSNNQIIQYSKTSLVYSSNDKNNPHYKNSHKSISNLTNNITTNITNNKTNNITKNLTNTTNNTINQNILTPTDTNPSKTTAKTTTLFSSPLKSPVQNNQYTNTIQASTKLSKIQLPLFQNFSTNIESTKIINILIVEDEFPVFKAYQRSLLRLGKEKQDVKLIIHHVENPIVAISVIYQLFTEYKTLLNLIITDDQMPYMNGVRFASVWKDILEDSFYKVDFVLCSGNNNTESCYGYSRKYFKSLHVKPVNYDTMRDIFEGITK